MTKDEAEDAAANAVSTTAFGVVVVALVLRVFRAEIDADESFDESRRRRGLYLNLSEETSRDAAAAATRIYQEETNRGDAAATTPSRATTPPPSRRPFSRRRNAWRTRRSGVSWQNLRRSAARRRFGGRAALLQVLGLDAGADRELSDKIDGFVAWTTGLGGPPGFESATLLVLYGGAFTVAKVACLDALTFLLAISSGVLFGGVVEGALAAAGCATFGSAVAFGISRRRGRASHRVLATSRRASSRRPLARRRRRKPGLFVRARAAAGTAGRGCARRF